MFTDPPLERTGDIGISVFLNDMSPCVDQRGYAMYRRRITVDHTRVLNADLVSSFRTPRMEWTQSASGGKHSDRLAASTNQ